MRLSKLASAVKNGKIIANGEWERDISALTADSREKRINSLFFCLKGNTADGHAYAAEAVKNGAIALVTERQLFIDVPQILVDDVRETLGILSSVFYGEPSKRLKVIGLTGTNGKTTTVSMLAQTLERGGLSAKACGNIGSPMIDYCTLSDNAVAVAEISSFQLETIQSIRPHIAMILNITEDHLNRHYNMENYVFLKGKLLKNCTETEYAVLNYDDPIVRGFAEKTKANVLYFSVKERVSGAYYEEGNLYFGKEKILSASDLPIGGLHNVQNALAVIVAAKIMGIKNVDIVAALTDFKGIKHRVETVDTINGVTFIDDSKGTNVDATLKAVEAMKADTVLLLGGKNKGYDYGKLFSFLPKTKVVHAVLYGENRFALLKAAREYNFEKITVCDGFDFAVQVAALKATSGQTVLLSPASASFDQFANYEERGDKFVEIVRSFIRTGNQTSTIEQHDTEDGVCDDIIQDGEDAE